MVLFVMIWLYLLNVLGDLMDGMIWVDGEGLKLRGIFVVKMDLWGFFDLLVVWDLISNFFLCNLSNFLVKVSFNLVFWVFEWMVVFVLWNYLVINVNLFFGIFILVLMMEIFV